MFSKLSLLALCAAAPLISALTLHIPDAPTSQGEITIYWDSAPGDPATFTLELIHPDFRDKFAIANNLDPSQGSITLTLPVLTAQGGYTLEAVNIGDLNDVYATTGSFSIGQSTGTYTPVPQTSTTGTSSAASTGSVTRSGSAAPSGSGVSSGAHSGSSGASSSETGSAGPVVSNLAGEDGAAFSNIASRVGILGAAVAGVALAL